MQPNEPDGVAAQAQDKAQEAATQAKEQAGQAMGQARDQMRTQVDTRSTQAGEQVTAQAGDIRTVAEQLREQGKDKPAQLAEQAADRAERLGTYLQQSDADRILGDVEDFARQRPWAVLAGGVALGFAASRFLKASSTDRYRAGTGARTATPSTTGSSMGTDVEAARDERDQRITREHNELSSGVPVGAGAAAGRGEPAPTSVTAGAGMPAVPPTAHPSSGGGL